MISTRQRYSTAWLVAIGFASSACMKTSLTFKVRDPGAVGVSMTTALGVAPLVPPDGADRSVVIPIDGRRAVTLVRQRPMFAVFSDDSSTQIDVVDGWGMLPPIIRGRGVGVREGYIDLRYNLTASRLLPESQQPVGSVPIVVSTDLRNVAEARLVHEPRRWPAYVLLPLGGVSALIGSAKITEDRRSEVRDGTAFLIASIPLVALGLVSALMSTTYETVDLGQALSAGR